MTPAERALIRSALPNFVNFMRFLHPGPACAAKFASSTAELGWDGSLMHCKSRGALVPSFTQTLGKYACFPWCGPGNRRNSASSQAPFRPVCKAVDVLTYTPPQTSPQKTPQRKAGPRQGRPANVFRLLGWSPAVRAAFATTRVLATLNRLRRAEAFQSVYQTRQEFTGYIG